MKRLTIQQYTNGIQDVFGESVQVTLPLEEDEASEAFLSMGAAKVGTSERGVEQYHDAAIDIAEQVVSQAADSNVLRDCVPFEPGQACVSEALMHFGTRLWRRPLTDAELNRIVHIQSAVDDPTVEPTTLWSLGMTHAIAALVASPHYVYVPEAGEPVPNSDIWRYTSSEMASRLAYLIWDSIPDEALLDAAARGELSTPEGVKAQAARMLAMPRAEALATRFFGEAWRVSKLTPLDKNLDVYPTWTPELLDAYQTEFDLFLRDLTVARNGDLRDVLLSRTSFVNDTLAGAYGMGPGSSDYEPTPLEDGRTGLLTSGAVVAAISPSDRTSPTHRGVFVLEDLLCVEVPPPPPSVDDTLEQPDTSEAQTLREKLEKHRTDPACAGCHGMFDPLGFTFEHFDAIGTYRDMDGEFPVDASGELGSITFDGVQDVAKYIAEDERFTACITERLYTFATGHQPVNGERVVTDELTDSLRDHYRFQQLVLDIVTSDAFRYLEPAKAEGE
jgi:hypothetical protein